METNMESKREREGLVERDERDTEEEIKGGCYCGSERQSKATTCGMESREGNEGKEKQRQRQTDRHTESKIDRHTDIQRVRQIDLQTVCVKAGGR